MSNGTTVVLARLRLLELTGNNTKSPFHGCHHFLLLLSTYLGLLIGGVIALPWLMLSCWSTWGLRMICFSWGGLANVFDLFCLPSAVSAFQQRSRQTCVRKELRKRLRAALKGLNLAAFVGEDNISDGKSDARITSTNSTDGVDTIRGGSSSTKAFQPPTDVPIDSKSQTDTCPERQRKQLQQNEFRGTDDGNRGDAGELPKTLRRRSTRLLQQQMRQIAPDDSTVNSKTVDSKTASTKARDVGGTASQKTDESSFNFSETRSSDDPEQAGHTSLANVKEELQHADVLRKQRAAAAAEASAAANARRLGLTTLTDCQRLAGKVALTDEDVEQLLEKAHVEPELLTFPGAAAAGREKRSLGRGSWLARFCRLPLSSSCQSVNAASISVILPSVPHAGASAVSSSASDARSTSCGSCANDGSAVGDPTAATGVVPATASVEKRSSAESRLTVEATKASCSLRERGESGRRGHGSSSSAAAARDSCPASRTVDQHTSSNDISSSSRGVSCLSDARSCKQHIISSSISTSSSTSDGSAGGNNSSGRVGEGAAKNDDANSRADERQTEWKSLIPWQLIFRGLVAHIQCTYVVDVLFCHAQLSPLSDSIQRVILLVLHCLIRGLTIFFAFASPYARVPYSSSLLTRHLVYSLFMCVAASFGTTACLLLAPIFVEEVLQPLLRLLLLPESIVESDALLLFVDLRFMLPSLPAHYNGTTWNARMDFYAACQIVSLAVVATGAYAAARLYDAEPRAAAAAKRLYAKDVLTLLTLREHEQAGGGALGEVSAVGSVLAGDQRRPETTSALPLKKEGCEGRQGTIPANESSPAAETVDVSRESLLEKRAANGMLSGEEKGRNSDEEVLRSVGKDAEPTPGRPYDAEHQQQKQLREQKEGMKEDGRFSLLLAEKVIEERMFLEASDFELLRTRVLKRIFLVAAAVATTCLLLCWATVGFLAVSNVAMRVNTASDILQERNNIRLMTAVAAAVALFDDEAGDGFQDWAEEIRLLQEELRDVVAYYRKVQQERGWLAATVELWDKLREEFTAAGEIHTTRRKQEISAYTVLGVKPSATGADIKKAYKLLAKQLHPDILAALASDKPATPEELDLATERMRQINAAYEKLMRKHGGRAAKSTS